MKHLFTFLFLILGSICLAQQKVVFTKNIDSLITQYIFEKDLPSASVGVVHQSQILYEKRIVKDSKEVKADTDNSLSIYNIASVAKPLVATAIMLLVQEGKIDLKAPVVNYLPYFKLNSKFTQEITVAHLLTHTSGLPPTSAPDDYQYLSVDTTDEALIKHIRSLSTIKLKFKPGKKYAYSNLGFEVLGEIIARVSGLSFDRFMQTQLFQPLEMNSTSYILSDFSDQKIAQPHASHPYKKTDRFPYNRAFSPSGNLFTSIKDMNKWMIFNLNQGQYKDFKPLSEENFKYLRTPQIDTREDGFVGLSWFIKDDLIFHDGLDLGYSALMLFFSRPKIGIVVLVNHQEADCNELINLIAQSIKY